VPMSLN